MKNTHCDAEDCILKAAQLVGRHEGQRHAEAHTFVAFQHLHNFSRLQIPEEDFAILATRYDPLPASEAKTYIW